MSWTVPVLVLVIGNFMAVLDITIVNVAIPSIQKDFGGGLEDVLWIATAYTLTLGVVVPLTSWLGDKFGLTWVYVSALAAFAIGSALCGAAWDLPSLVVFRIFQAVPGGIMPVVAMTLVYRIVPRHKLGTAMGIFGLALVFAPAMGPVIGGYFVEYLDWRLVFFVNAPVGLLGAVAAYLALPRTPGMSGRRFDLPGFCAIAIGLFAILLAASKGTDWGWDGYRVRMLVVGGVLCLALFVVIELQVREPLLDLRVFRVWQFSLSLVMLSVQTLNLMALSFFLPVFLQLGQDREALNVGLMLLPPAMLMGVMSPLVGRLYDKIGPRRLAVPGLCICAYGTWLLSSITPESPVEDIVLWGCVRGAGLGLALMPVMTVGLAWLPAAQTNLGSALNNVFRQTTGALGLATLSALSTSQQAQLMADRGAVIQGSGPPPPTQWTIESFGGAYGRYHQLSAQVLGTSYSNLYVIIALLTATGAVCALLVRAPERDATVP